MSSRDDLHRMVDELDDAALPDAARALSEMVSQRAPRHDDLSGTPRRRLSFVGAFSSGQRDLATRSAEILRDELGRAEH